MLLVGSEHFVLELREVELRAGDLLVDLEHVLAGRLEVRRRVVRLSHEDLRTKSVIAICHYTTRVDLQHSKYEALRHEH